MKYNVSSRKVVVWLAAITLLSPSLSVALTVTSSPNVVSSTQYSATTQLSDVSVCVSGGETNFYVVAYDQNYVDTTVLSTSTLSSAQVLTYSVSNPNPYVEVDFDCGTVASPTDVILGQLFTQFTVLNPGNVQNPLTSVVISATTTSTTTSDVEQTQQNLSTAFWFFFVSMFGTIWLLRKQR